jgi:hypothetical protein
MPSLFLYELTLTNAELCSYNGILIPIIIGLAHYRSQNSVVGTVTRLWPGQSGVWILAGATCPDQLQAPPSLLFNGYQGSFQAINQLQCDVDYSTSSGAEVKNVQSTTSAPTIGLHGVDKHNFTFFAFTFSPIYVTNNSISTKNISHSTLSSTATKLQTHIPQVKLAKY